MQTRPLAERPTPNAQKLSCTRAKAQPLEVETERETREKRMRYSSVGIKKIQRIYQAKVELVAE